MTDSKPKKLTVKQTKFVKAYVANDGNGQEAAKIAYNVNTDVVARSMASENLTKPNIQQAIEQALIKHEITMDAAIKPIAMALKAYKSNVDAEGNVTTSVDHSTRLKASSMSLKLLGAEQKEPLASGNTFNFINNANFDSKKYVK